MKGQSKKFQYITFEGAIKAMDIDGSEFSDNDYGVLVDASPDTQLLTSKLETLAQAALQNQTLNFSSIMKIYTSASLSEIQRIIEKDERNREEQITQQAQAEQQAAQQQLQVQAQQDMLNKEHEDRLNQRDNDTKLLIAEMQLQNKEVPVVDNSMDQAKLDQADRHFSEKLHFDKTKSKEELALKKRALNNKSTT